MGKKNQTKQGNLDNALYPEKKPKKTNVRIEHILKELLRRYIGQCCFRKIMGTGGINLLATASVESLVWRIDSISLKKGEKTTFDREPGKEAVTLLKLEFCFCNCPTLLCH